MIDVSHMSFNMFFFCGINCRVLLLLLEKPVRTKWKLEVPLDVGGQKLSCQ